MKKLLSGLALSLLLLLPLAAGAETQESWNEGSGWRITEDAAVWNLPADSLTGAAPVITLPKGTWVRVVSVSGQWTVIDYFAGGSVRSGAVISYQVLADGATPSPVPTAAPTPIPLDTAIPSTVNPTPEPTPVDAGGLLSPYSEPTASPTPDPASGLAVTVTADGTVFNARVVMLGSCASVVRLNDGSTVSVPSKGIVCSDQVPDGHQIAAISAPKKGTATFRAGESGKSATLGKLKHGQLVCVLEEGSDYCRIWSEGKVGYVTASVLQYDVLVNQTQGTVILCSASGKTSGNDTVNVRVNPKKSSTRVVEWDVGLEVTVLEIQGDWYLVEHEGQRGYVNTQFIKK